MTIIMLAVNESVFIASNNNVMI